MVYQLTLTGLVLGSTITVFEAGTTNVLAQSIDHGSTSFVYTYSDGGFNVRIVIGAVGYAQTILSITAPSADTTLPVSQTVDRSLLIPVSAAAAARKAIDAISPAEVEALIDDLGPGVSSWNDLLDKPSSFPPSPHKSSHVTGGSDPLTPADIGAEASSNKGQPGGYASLDGSGQIPAAQIPSIAITEFLGTAANEASMLALSGQRGDWCVRTDTGTAWIITGTDPAILAGWTQFVYPAAPVSSVAGRTGAVTLSTADVSGLGNSATRNVGTTPGTVAAGDDARLSDPRTPTAHTHPLSDLQQSGATARQIAEWSGSAWAPVTPSLYRHANGSITAQIPDNTATGGNARGVNSADLSQERTAANQVASGIGSFCAGRRVSAIGNYSAAIGADSIAAGPRAIALGEHSIASGESSLAFGGGLASGAYSTALGRGTQATGMDSACIGRDQVASGERSWIPGGGRARTHGIYGSHAWSGASRSTAGDNQHFGGVFQRETADATATILTADRSSPSSTNVLILPNNCMWAGFVYIAARSTAGDVASWCFWITARRGANAAETAVMDSHTIRHYPDGLPTASVSVVANTTRGSIEVQVTGIAATTIDWIAEFFGVNTHR